MHKFTLIFIQNCDHFRFLGYVSTLSGFGYNEIKNRFECLGRGGGVDGIEVRMLGVGITPKRTKVCEGRGSKTNNERSCF